jgi:hypothetical protein
LIDVQDFSVGKKGFERTLGETISALAISPGTLEGVIK